MALKFIQDMKEATEYAEDLEVRLAASQATCDDLSRIVACLVFLHDGTIPSRVWDQIQNHGGFVGYGKRTTEDGVQIEAEVGLKRG